VAVPSLRSLHGGTPAAGLLQCSRLCTTRNPLQNPNPSHHPSHPPPSPQIYGPESSGKTTLALHAIAEVQKAGGNAVFIDAEHAFDQTYAKVGGESGGREVLAAFRSPARAAAEGRPSHRNDAAAACSRPRARRPRPPPRPSLAAPQKLGIDTAALLVSQPDHGEMAFNILDELVGAGAGSRGVPGVKIGDPPARGGASDSAVRVRLPARPALCTTDTAYPRPDRSPQVRSGSVDIIVVDSVSALTPRSEVEGDIGTPQVTRRAP
jgi:RecA/RadA recombinase